MPVPDIHGAEPLLALAIVLGAGLVLGALARRIHLPGVTGQIIAGVLLGPHVLDLLAPEAITSLEPVTHFALGFMGVTIGAHLSLRRMRNAGRRLTLLLIAEATVVPVVVGISIVLFTDVRPIVAALLATLAVSTAPATTVAIVRELRAEGLFVKTLIGAVALNNVACIVLFEVARSAARVELDPTSTHSITALLVGPARQLLIAVGMGAGLGWLAHELTRGVHSEERLGTTGALALLVAVGLARWLDVSPLLTCVILGFVQTNLTPRRDKIADRVFGNLEPVVLAVFFTLAGMHLSFDHAARAGFVAFIFFSARAVAKIGAGRLAMTLAGATRPLRRWLGVALVPQAGVAIGLVILVQDDPVFAPVRDIFIAVVLTSVTLNEIVGPILTRQALARSGERGRDRPRLLDFFGEQNIVTDFHAASKQDALEKLTDLLISSHHLRDADREALLGSILEREVQESTSIGCGIAIPHGVLHGGSGMVGVIALSREPLPFESPDGEPVRCVVLLATPEGERDRHLAVLSSLARTLGHDRDVRERLIGARSPAHAYEILHAGEVEHFNPFLDEE